MQTTGRSLLQQAVRLSGAIQETSPDLIVVHDHDGFFIDVNSRACEVLGYSREEFLNMRVTDIEQDFDLPYAQSAWLNMEPGLTYTVHGRHRRKNGSPLAVEVQCRVVLADGQRLYVGVARNLAELSRAQEELEAAQDRLRLMMASLEEYALITLDAQGRILTWNKGAQRLTGYEAQEVLYQPLQRLCLSADVANAGAAQLLQSAARQGRCHEQGWCVRKDGSRFFASTIIAANQDRNADLLGFTALLRDISDLKAAEAALALSRTQLQALIDHAPVALAQFDCHMRYLAVSRRWREDYSLGERELVGHSHYEIFPEIPDRWKEVHRRGMAGETVRVDEDLFERHDGSVQWLRWEVRPWRTQDGAIAGIVIFSEDISQRRESERSLLMYGNAYMHCSEPIVITDQRNKIVSVNPAFTDETGYTLEDVKGCDPQIFSSGRTPTETYKEMWTALAKTGSWQGELWDRRKDGGVFPRWTFISVIRDAEGQITHHIASFRDISEIKSTTEKISRLAYYDSLTGLANRQLFTDRMKHAVLTAARSGEHGAVLFVDLDHFKTINDTLGHQQGDVVLQEVARRILLAVRQGDTVARFGGDEFVVLLENLGGVREQAALAAKSVGDKLLDVLSQPLTCDGKAFSCSASIGVSLWRGSLKSGMQSLLARADLAMYEAKKAGRNRLRFFEQPMQLELEARSQLEARLRLALQLGHFVLHYQRCVGPGGRVARAEALLRWQDPGQGLVAPLEFIGVAEDSGVMVPIGSWVLRSACDQLARWAQSQATSQLVLSVNISPKQFLQDSFVAEVASVLSEFRVKPEQLQLEITENLLAQRLDEVTSKMRALRQVGVSFALDNFGTGNCSLSSLQRLPLNALKIDRSCIRDVATDKDAEMFVRTMIQMGQNMGLEVVAQGVESESQRNALLQLGCQNFQGFLFGQPLAADEFDNEIAGPRRP